MSAEQLTQIYTDFVWCNVHKCRNCSQCRCIEACENGVIARAGGFWHKRIVLENSDKCTGCKRCVDACPHNVFNEMMTYDLKI